MTDETNWQEKLMHFRMLQEHIEKLTEHVQLLNQQNAELENSKQALEDLSNTKPRSEVLAPVANGVFIKTELKENTHLLVNVGADTVVEKSVEEVVALLGNQQKEISGKITEAEMLLQGFHSQAAEIYQEVQGAEE